MNNLPQEIISAYVEAQRAIDEADKAYAEKSRLMRAACKKSTELALIAAGHSLSRGERLELVSNFYWLETDVAPMPVLEGLRFHAPTGFPRNGIPLLLTGEQCPKCEEEMLKQSRQGIPHCPRCWMGVRERDVRDYMQSRGAVRVTSEHGLEWVCPSTPEPTREELDAYEDCIIEVAEDLKASGDNPMRALQAYQSELQYWEDECIKCCSGNPAND